MLDEVRIEGGACFGPGPLDITAIQTVSFFFGPNGSGKTTISRALAGSDSLRTTLSWTDSAPMNVMVYNRDFVDQTLRESSRMPGVFVIGTKSVEAEKRLEAIEGDNGERARAVDSLRRAEASLTDAEAKDAAAHKGLLDATWAAYKRLTEDNPLLLPAFTGAGGVGSSKQKLLEKLLTLTSTEQPTPTLVALNADAGAVFTDGTAVEEVPAIPSYSLAGQEGADLIDKAVIGSDEVSLSALVQQLGNSDWVSSGRDHLADAGGLCPFCQQDAPADLAADLAVMFDHQYEDQKAQIASLRDNFAVWSERVRTTIAPPQGSLAYLDEAAYAKAHAHLMSLIANITSTLERKAQNPSEILTIDSLDGAIDALNDVIRTANTEISTHNALVANRRRERPLLSSRCWRYLAEDVLRDTLAEHRSKQSGRDRGKSVLATRVEAANQAIADLDEEIRSLQRSVESTRPVIDQINAILQRTGFTSFTIVESKTLKDGYMLSRIDGEVQEHSLSEGERTFIAFLYYFHALGGRGGNADPHRTVAVIDDPISSLDSDILFVVSALVRDLIARALSGSDAVKQVLVLTHNVYFHKEVTYLRDGDASGSRTYFLIHKRHSAPSTIESRRSNPVTTEYRRLWDEVRRATEGETMNVVGLENILRRILESYFRVMGGGIWDHEIAPLLIESERHAFRALFGWVNEGSHAVLEDVYYSPSVISQDVYLTVFRRVFEVTKHEAHYQMMLHGKKSLPISGDAEDDAVLAQ